ncbi:tetratricopeptide repeat protein [Desulfovibrio sp. OttesenSCG-928-F07]|nr:tetratricopeptide repeat protein [Desulfovibrio sp. OttesenSCG-928-F07]
MSAKRTSSGNMVKKQTLYIAVVIAFCFGLYGGHLATTISQDSAGSSGVTKQVVTPGVVNPDNDPELQRLKKAVSDNPQSANAWSNLGHWYFDNDMPEDAVKAYESSLLIKPNDANVITDLGVMYRNLHNHEKALELFRRASRVDPKHLQSRFNEGVVLMYDFEREDEAMQVWAAIVKLDPSYKTPNGKKLADWVKEYESSKR